MDESSLVIVREWGPNDVPFIYSTWRNAIYYGWLELPGLEPRPQPKEFFKIQTIYIDGILEVADVRVAVLSDDPDTIVGYGVYSSEHLYFIYVKEAYRREGIGKLLYPSFIETVGPQLTKVGAAIVRKKGLKVES